MSFVLNLSNVEDKKFWLNADKSLNIIYFLFAVDIRYPTFICQFHIPVIIIFIQKLYALFAYSVFNI